MFHRYIYFKTEPVYAAPILQAWRSLTDEGLIERYLNECGQAPWLAETCLKPRHCLQQRTQADQRLITWMDVMSDFISIQTLDRYHSNVEKSWLARLAVIVPSLERHIETFQTCA